MQIRIIGGSFCVIVCLISWLLFIINFSTHSNTFQENKRNWKKKQTEESWKKKKKNLSIIGWQSSPLNTISWCWGIPLFAIKYPNLATFKLFVYKKTAKDMGYCEITWLDLIYQLTIYTCCWFLAYVSILNLYFLTK